MILCCNPIPEPFEFPITCNCNTDSWELDIKDYYSEKDNLCELKQKIIYDFWNIIDRLKCGIQPDLELLLEEISLVYIYNE